MCAAADLVVDGTCAGGDASARVHLIGYSYGSTVCAYALGQRSCIASYVAIGYPRGSYGCGLFGVGAKWLMRDHASRLMEDETTPKLFVHPSRDEFTTVQTMERFVGEKLSKGVKELRVLEGAGHFAFVQDEAAADARTRRVVTGDADTRVDATRVRTTRVRASHPGRARRALDMAASSRRVFHRVLVSGHDIGCRGLISARFVDVTTTRSDILANLYVFTVRTGPVGCNMREK